MDKDISKKRDRSTTQRIVIRNEVEYRNPYSTSGDNPYYQASPTLASGVYGKRRFRAVMAYGTTPYAYVEVDRNEVTATTVALGRKLKRGAASITTSVKGVGTTHTKNGKLWVGWMYGTDKDYNPALTILDNRGRSMHSTKSIVKDIKTVIDELNK